MTLNDHYSQALGLSEPWNVKDVILDTKAKTVDIEVAYRSGTVSCPACGKACRIRDTGECREWRHLDMMGFKTVIHARIPRADCKEHGIRSAAVPVSR